MEQSDQHRFACSAAAFRAQEGKVMPGASSELKLQTSKCLTTSYGINSSPKFSFRRTLNSESSVG